MNRFDVIRLYQENGLSNYRLECLEESRFAFLEGKQCY